MKLSEAIRLGCMMDEGQNFGHYYNGTKTRSCALGAAMMAVGHNPLFDGDYSWSDMPSEFHFATCPLCSHDMTERVKVGESLHIIVHLNDDHKLSREAIADWVETQEQTVNITSKPEIVVAK